VLSDSTVSRNNKTVHSQFHGIQEVMMWLKRESLDSAGPQTVLALTID